MLKIKSSLILMLVLLLLFSCNRNKDTAPVCFDTDYRVRNIIPYRIVVMMIRQNVTSRLDLLSTNAPVTATKAGNIHTTGNGLFALNALVKKLIFVPGNQAQDGYP